MRRVRRTSPDHDQRLDEQRQRVEQRAQLHLEFQHVPDAADDAAAEPGSAVADGHQHLHPAARLVQRGRAADQHQQQSAAAHPAADRERDASRRCRWSASRSNTASATAPLQNGQASFAYTLPSAAAQTALVGHGRATATSSTARPAQTSCRHATVFNWNGQTNTGQQHAGRRRLHAQGRGGRRRTTTRHARPCSRSARSAASASATAQATFIVGGVAGADERARHRQSHANTPSHQLDRLRSPGDLP